jgi:hypothetical protein
VAGAAAVEATVEVRDIAAARGTPTARPGFSIDIGRLARWLDEQGVAGIGESLADSLLVTLLPSSN